MACGCMKLVGGKRRTRKSRQGRKARKGRKATKKH